MKYIKLSQGRRAKVDDEDFKRLSKLKWHFNYGYARNNSLNANGKKTTIRMHRVILNAPKGKDVDHINGDGLDNRKQNLRVCTRSENAMNQRLSSANTSGYKGVVWYKRSQKWRVQVNVKNKKTHVGYFNEIGKAVKAYDTAVMEHYGVFARPNLRELQIAMARK